MTDSQLMASAAAAA